MVLNCSAVIGNPDEMKSFTERLEELGIRPRVVGETVYVEYKGYNMTRFNSIVDAFEDKRRHTIDTHGA